MYLLSSINLLPCPLLSRWQVLKAGLVLLCLGVLLLAGLAAPTQAAGPGDLDPTFDGDGWVTTSFNGPIYDRLITESGINAIAYQSDGKLVAAGYALDNDELSYAVLARYNLDGSLDTTFDGDGKLITAINGTYYYLFINALAVQPDGKLVVAGSKGLAFPDFFLARYNPNGSLDTSFDGDGIVTLEFTGFYDHGGISALAVQPDGKLVVAGYLGGSSGTAIALARYNANGSRDTSFNGGGLVATFISGGNSFAEALVLQPDGKLVAAGRSNDDFVLARYHSNGSLDATFDGDGMVTTSFGADTFDSANALVLQSDGKLVAAGQTLGANTNDAADFALARYNPNGSLDTSFDSDGLISTAISANDPDLAKALVVQPDGRLVAAGYSKPTGHLDFALVRYNPNGSLDTSFNGDGITTSDAGVGSLYSAAEALVLQPDGKLVLAGSSGDDYISNNFVLARYIGGSLPALSVSKTAQPDPVAPGGTLTYTIQVKNYGSIPLHATITDTLPAHVTPGGQQVWTANLPAWNGVWSQTVVVTVDPGYTGALVNRVDVTTAEGLSASAQTITNGQKNYLPVIIKN